MIELKNVCKSYATRAGPIDAVKDVSLHLAEGETLCLIGTSGSGKTTTLRMLNRLEDTTSGSIFVAGQPIANLPLISLRRSMGYVIQRGGLFPHLTVAKNIGLLAKLEGWRQEKIQARVDELLQLVDLSPEDFAHRRPRELSGGQQQRVSIARALMLDPKILLMDEPFGALDPITRAQLHEAFLRLKKVVKKTVVLVTHDMAEAFQLADKIAVMDQGRVVQVGTPQQLQQSPATPFVEEFLSTLHHQPVQITDDARV